MNRFDFVNRVPDAVKTAPSSCRTYNVSVRFNAVIADTVMVSAFILSSIRLIKGLLARISMIRITPLISNP